MKLRILLLPFVLLFASGLAQNSASTKAPTPVETTPTELPGAETYIYRNDGAEPMRLFVVKPKGWKPSDKRSALVFFFGGGWTRGTPEKSISWARYAASLGMVGIAPDYRTKSRFDTSPLEAVADSRAAFNWVQTHAAKLGIDPKKIAVGGNSAGGHVALWTAIEKSPPGSSDAEAPKIKPAALILMSAVSDTSLLSGYTPTRFGENATPLSPLHQLDKKMPPVIAFHGDADPTVPVSQAYALRDKLVENGNECELTIVPGGNHGFSSQFPEWKDKSRQLIVKFLRKHRLIN